MPERYTTTLYNGLVAFRDATASSLRSTHLYPLRDPSLAGPNAFLAPTAMPWPAFFVLRGVCYRMPCLVLTVLFFTKKPNAAPVKEKGEVILCRRHRCA